MPSVLQIVKIIAVGVCLTLERDIIVCLFPVSILNKPARPLDEIEDIKRHKQQFALLGSVNTFVVDDIPVNPARIPRPKRPEQIQAYPFRHQLTLYNHAVKRCYI